MRKQAMYAAIIGALLLAVLLGAMVGVGNAPALAAAPTPVAITQPVGLQPALYTLISGNAITQSVQGTCRELGKWALLDAQTTIDVSDTQTVTVKIQYSNDGVNLVDGANLAASVITDGSTFYQAPLFGRYACAYATLATTAPVTVSVTGWAK